MTDIRDSMSPAVPGAGVFIAWRGARRDCIFPTPEIHHADGGG